MSRVDIAVKCTRCRFACMESEWCDVASKRFAGCTEKTCPRCGCKAFYDMSPQVAWCWASGLIEIGDSLPPDNADGSGAIQIATGPKAFLKGHLSGVARHGQGASAGELLVPGIPEADGQDAKGDALAEFLAWCGKHKSRNGVVFAKAPV